MRFVSGQRLESVQRRLINLARAKLLNELVIVDPILVGCNNLPGIDDLLAFLDVCVLAVLCEVCTLLGLGGLVQRHSGENGERMVRGHVSRRGGEGGGETKAADER